MSINVYKQYALSKDNSGVDKVLHLIAMLNQLKLFNHGWTSGDRILWHEMMTFCIRMKCKNIVKATQS